MDKNTEISKENSTLNENPLSEMLGQIIDIMEDYLDNNKMTIINVERDKALKGEGGPDDTLVHIWGNDYDTIANAYRMQTACWDDFLPPATDTATLKEYAKMMTDMFVEILEERGCYQEGGSRIQENAIDRAYIENKALETFNNWGLNNEISNDSPERENPETRIFYGVVQGADGCDGVGIYTEQQLREEFDENGISEEYIPTSKNEHICEDIGWPSAGSAGSTSIFRLEGIYEAIAFIKQDAYGPNLDDPTLEDIAKYQWDVMDDWGCTGQVCEEFKIRYGNYSQADPRFTELCDKFGIGFEDFFKDDMREIPYSEADEKIPEALAKRVAEHTEEFKKENPKLYEQAPDFVWSEAVLVSLKFEIPISELSYCRDNGSSISSLNYKGDVASLFDMRDNTVIKRRDDAIMEDLLKDDPQKHEYYKTSDGWFDYYVNKETGEKKLHLDEGDIEVPHDMDDFYRDSSEHEIN